MKLLWGYSELDQLLKNHPSINTGILVDTNVLISATYDMDQFFERTTELIYILIDKNIPLFCNVNVRSEFLEIHRRIIFTEALLSFESVTKGSALSLELRKKLSSLRSNQNNREEQGRAPVRLSEAEIKTFKALMIQQDGGNLWNRFSTSFINDSILKTWEDAVHLMSFHGLSSSDAMIVNMYRSSIFELILSSDADIGYSVAMLKQQNKLCLLPDKVVNSIGIQ